MKLFGCDRTRSDRVRWMLEEVGAAYEYEPVDLLKGAGRSPAYRAINPAGKVPAFEIDGHYLTESAAICRLLVDRFPAAGLIPLPGTRERAQCEQWCDFAISELEQPLWLISKHRFALPEALRIAAVLPTAEWEFGQAAALLSRALDGRPFMLGEQFSVADILLCHTLAWARKYKLPLGAGNLDGYLERALARPAWQRVRALWAS